MLLTMKLTVMFMYFMLFYSRSRISLFFSFLLLFFTGQMFYVKVHSLTHARTSGFFFSVDLIRKIYCVRIKKNTHTQFLEVKQKISSAKVATWQLYDVCNCSINWCNKIKRTFMRLNTTIPNLDELSTFDSKAFIRKHTHLPISFTNELSNIHRALYKKLQLNFLQFCNRNLK